MSLDSKAIRDAIISHAMATGLFERVNGHESENAPGNGLTCVVAVASLGPHVATSGLAVTSARLVFNVQVFNPMQQQPLDDVDITVLDATDALFAAYGGDFDLGGTVQAVDLLGRGGTPMGAVGGYIKQDNRTYRAMTITLPVIVTDVWDQEG